VPSSINQVARLSSWLEEVVGRSASDLLLVPGAPPHCALTAWSCPLAEGPLSGDEVEDAVVPALAPRAANAANRASPTARSDRRISDASGINLHHERGRATPRDPSSAFPPSPVCVAQPVADNRSAHAPAARSRARRRTDRIGKTTTLAALVNEINLREARHIITIEDPIEYEHPHRRSIV
jgi:twitching motility protein PilT